MRRRPPAAQGGSAHKKVADKNKTKDKESAHAGNSSSAVFRSTEDWGVNTFHLFYQLREAWELAQGEKVASTTASGKK